MKKQKKIDIIKALHNAMKPVKHPKIHYIKASDIIYLANQLRTEKKQ